MSSHDDLKAVTNESDWFVTITIPTPSTVDDARARFELEWRNARRKLSADWDDPTWRDGARLVDRAIVAAFATNAEIVVVSRLAMMDRPLAALMRW